MAGTLADLVVKVGADIKGFEVGLERIDQKLKDVGRTIEAASKDFKSPFSGIEGSLTPIFGKFDELSGKFENIGRAGRALEGPLKATGAALTGIGVAGVAGLGLAANAAIDFETAFTGVKKVLDATPEEFAALETEIRKLALVLPVSASELAGIAETAGQLGIKKEDIIGFTRTIAELGIATNITGEEGALALAQFINTTTATAAESRNLANVIVDLGNNSATLEDNILNMATRIGLAGTQAGLSADEVLGFSSALASTGISAELGGTNFSKFATTISSAVISGGADLEGFAAVAGTTAEEFRKSYQDDASGAIQQFLEGLALISEGGGDVAGTLDVLGFKGEETQRAILALASRTKELGDDLDRAAVGFGNFDAINEEVARRLDTTAAQFDTFKNNLTDIAITIGGPVLTGLNTLIEAFRPIIAAVGEFAAANPTLTATIVAIGAALSGLTLAVGPVLVVFGQIAGSIGTLLPLMSTFGLSIGSTGTAGATLTGVLGSVGSAVGGLGSTLLSFLPSLGSVSALFTGLPAAIAPFLAALGPIALKIAAVIAVLDLINIGLGFLIQNWDSIHQAIADVTERVWSTIASFLGTVWGGIVSAAETVFPGISDFIASVWQSIADTVGGVWAGIVSFLAGTWNSIAETASKIWGGIKDIFGEVYQAWKDAPRATDYLVDALSASNKAAADASAEAEKLKSATEDVTTANKDAANPAAAAAKSMADLAKATTKTKDAAKEAKPEIFNLTAAINRQKEAATEMNRIANESGRKLAEEFAGGAQIASLAALNLADLVAAAGISLTNIKNPMDDVDISAINIANSLERLGVTTKAVREQELAQLQTDLGNLDAALAAGTITQDEYNAAIGRVREGLGLTQPFVLRLRDELVNLATSVQSAASNFVGAFLGSGSISEAASAAFDTLKNAGLSALQSLADKFIEIAGQKALGALISGIDAIIGKGPALQNILGGVLGIGGQAAGAAGTVAGAAGGAAQAGGAATQATAAVGQGLAGLVTAVSGVVTAITGVIGVFQAARQEGTLNAIELEQRQTKDLLRDQVLPALWFISDTLQFGPFVKTLENARDYLRGIAESVAFGPAVKAAEESRDFLRSIDRRLAEGLVAAGAAVALTSPAAAVASFADGGKTELVDLTPVMTLVQEVSAQQLDAQAMILSGIQLQSELLAQQDASLSEYEAVSLQQGGETNALMELLLSEVASLQSPITINVNNPQFLDERQVSAVMDGIARRVRRGVRGV